MPGDARLWKAIDELVLWMERNDGHTASRCLEAVRYALGQSGIRLPQSNVDYKGMLAETCGKTLAAKPEKWKWRLRGTSAKALPTREDGRPVLVFFRSCGWLSKYQAFAGHIAVYKPTTNKHLANFKGEMSVWWRARISYVFEPE